MGKQPSFQFYPGDWIKDTQLQMTSMSTQGVWINLLCAMWNSEERGRIEGTKENLCRLIGCSEKELNQFFNENKLQSFANVTNCNENVTIINRRMQRDEKERQGSKERVRKHRDKKDVTDDVTQKKQNVTAPSSSSSSSSSSNTEESLIETPVPMEEKSDPFGEESREYHLAYLLLKLARENQDDKKLPKHEHTPLFQTWCKTIDYIIRLDGKLPAEIEEVIRWSQADDFWRMNIRSPKKLREQYGDLLMKMDFEDKPHLTREQEQEAFHDEVQGIRRERAYKRYKDGPGEGDRSGT